MSISLSDLEIYGSHDIYIIRNDSDKLIGVIVGEDRVIFPVPKDHPWIRILSRDVVESIVEETLMQYEKDKGLYRLFKGIKCCRSKLLKEINIQDKAFTWTCKDMDLDELKIKLKRLDKKVNAPRLPVCNRDHEKHGSDKRLVLGCMFGELSIEEILHEINYRKFHFSDYDGRYNDIVLDDILDLFKI